MMAGADVGFGDAYLYRDSAGGIIYVLALEAVQVGAAVACVGLCRPWGERVPRRVPGLGGRRIPRRLPLVLGGVGNVLLYLIMAGIKQNGILGQLLRDSWLASAEHLV